MCVGLVDPIAQKMQYPYSIFNKLDQYLLVEYNVTLFLYPLVEKRRNLIYVWISDETSSEITLIKNL